MATNLIIGNQLYIPGSVLTLQQMIAINVSIALGNSVYTTAAPGTLEAQAYAQYLSQGGQQFIADSIAQGNLEKTSAGGIVGNASRARDENATVVNPSPPPVVIAPDGRITPAGSGANGTGQIAATNAVETPTQENNPTVGTNATVRPLSQTQATPSTYNNNGALTQAQLAALQQAPGSDSRYQPPIAPIAGPGAGALDGAGVLVPTRYTSPNPQYQARNQSYVYQAVQVISSFKAGKFEQTLKGILYTQQTANTTQTNAQQRPVANTTPAITKTQQSRPGTTSTQASVRAVDNAIIAASQTAAVDTFGKVDALGNYTGF